MKFSIVILILLATVLLGTCLGYSQVKEEKTSQKDIEKYGNELIEKDFLKYANPLKINTLEKQLKTSFDIYDREIYRFAHIDAEELAEFNFKMFLPQLQEILEKRNITLSVEETEDYQETNNIIVNGEVINLHSKQDLENMTFWDSAPKNFFRKINKILDTEHSNEQFYLLYAGNDLSVLLLTNKQFEIIRDKYKNNPIEIPYLP